MIRHDLLFLGKSQGFFSVCMVLVLVSTHKIMMSLVHKAMDFAFEKIIFDILREWIITVSEEYK